MFCAYGLSTDKKKRKQDGRDGFMNVRPYGYGEQSQSVSPVYIRALRHPTTLPCEPFPIHPPPTTHALQSPREHSVHNTPTRARHPHHSGQKKEKPGELGTRGDHVYPRLYVLDEPRFLPSSPQRGEYSTGWVICQHKSRKKVKRCILRTTLRRTETNQTSFFKPGMSLRIAPAAAAMRYAPTT